jgi:hypothetical protein
MSNEQRSSLLGEVELVGMKDFGNTIARRLASRSELQERRKPKVDDE